MANIQLKDLIPGKEYNIQVRSVNNLGESSEWSTTYSFTAPPQTIDPATLQPAPLETIFATQVGAGDGTNTSGLFKSSTFDGSVSSSDFSIPTLLSGAIDPAYVGTTGWAMDYKGNAVFSNAYVRGFINAQSGIFSGNITSTATISGGIIQTSSLQKISIDGTTDAISFTDIVGEQAAHILSASTEPGAGFAYSKGILMHIGSTPDRFVGSNYPFLYLSGEPETSDGQIVLATTAGNYISLYTYQDGEVSSVNISGTDINITGDIGLTGDLNASGSIHAALGFVGDLEGDITGNASTADSATEADWAALADGCDGDFTVINGSVIANGTGTGTSLFQNIDVDSDIIGSADMYGFVAGGRALRINGPNDPGTSYKFGTASSSRRVKSHIESIIMNDLEIENYFKINPVEYFYTSQIANATESELIGKVKEIGLIAEELQELNFNSLINLDENGIADYVHYDKLSIYNTIIIKIQQEKIKNLESRLAALESK